VENGAQIVDINFDDAMLDAKKEMVNFLRLLASEPHISRVTFMIDSSKWDVIEAALKSGSLITVNIAKKLKRKVWAVPGPITSRTSEATNLLIRSGIAQMWLDDKQLSRISSDDPLVQLLSYEPMTVNDIARKLVKPVEEIGAQLSLLTITGQLTEKDGKYYVCNH